jgi:hypothetical protein
MRAPSRPHLVSRVRVNQQCLDVDFGEHGLEDGLQLVALPAVNMGYLYRN